MRKDDLEYNPDFDVVLDAVAAPDKAHLLMTYGEAVQHMMDIQSRKAMGDVHPGRPITLNGEFSLDEVEALLVLMLHSYTESSV